MRKLFILMLLLCLCKAGVGQSVSDILAELPPVTQADRLQYWYDDDIGTLRSTQQLNGMHTFDVSALLDGLHTLHVQIIDNTDAICSPCSHAFLKLSKQSSIPSAKQLQYWFDDNEAITTAPLSSGVQLLDVNSLLDGLHTLHYQVVDENGHVTTPCSQVFLKQTTLASTAQPKHLRYWFDDDETTLRECAATSGLQMLDVSGLTSGLHIVHVQLVDEVGRLITPYSAVFLKIFTDGAQDGKNAITRYIYWVNDGTEEMVKTEVTDPDSVFQLVALLPVKEMPIRSNSFLFRIEDDRPVIYAQNDLHVRFFDTRGYSCDGSIRFTDCRVREEVTGITPLLPTQTFARPDENFIKWFSFEACKGDTVAFRSNQAITLQVFSPTGQKIFMVSGDETVAYGGCHTWEDGTYYVAVHDVTGSQANIKLDFLYEEAETVMGDVNADGEVNTLDASLATAYYLGNLANIIAWAADVNDDGVVDALDATQITQMFLDAQGIAPETNALPRRRVKPKQTLQP